MLKLENLHFLYNDKAIDGLHGIDLIINPAEIIGLMGPSGCGKSTLAKLITSQYSPSSGKITNTFSKVLYLENSLLIQNKTVLENFTHYAHGDNLDQKITKARMACSDLEITNYIETPISQLSTGQLQRVLLGVAIVAESQLVILDEPFSHLEQPLRQELVEIILPIFSQNQTSVLWISHDQKLLMGHCNQIAIMNYGKIIQIDTPEQIYFYPQSMFVADFLGECNKELLRDGSSLVWDQLLYEKQRPGSLLIYRPEALSINPDSQVQAELIESKFQAGQYLHCFQVQDTQLFMRNNLSLERFTKYGLELDMKRVRVLEEF